MRGGETAGLSDRISAGFEKNLNSLKNGLTDLLVLFIINIPLILIVAVFGILIYIIVRKVLGIRKDHAKRTGKDDKDGAGAGPKDIDDKGGKA